MSLKYIYNKIEFEFYYISYLPYFVIMSSEQELESYKDFKIGDFIEYASESYNGGF